MSIKLAFFKRVMPILAIPIFLTGVLLALLALTLPVYATESASTISVTTTMDEFGTGSDCSLREAIESANTDGDFGGCLRNGSAPYTITLPANSYTLTGTLGEDGNQTGDLDLRASMNIVGNGAESTIIQAGNTLSDSIDRVFHITTDTPMVTIANVTIRHGYIEDNNTNYYGGGILNEGTLVITGSQIMSNSANVGGGITNISQNSQSTVTLTILNSTISHNSADGGGGIINYGHAIVTISDSTISHNSGALAGGGGIHNDGGDLELLSSTLSYNSGLVGGGILHEADSAHGSLTISDSTISHNSAGFGSGIANLSNYSENSIITISGSTISDNTADNDGGGIGNYLFDWNNGHATVTIFNSTLSGNSAGENGGGIFNYSEGDNGSATVNLNFTTISGNSAGEDGGGILNYTGGVTGALTVNLKNSLITSNTFASGQPNDCSGRLDSYGYNLIFDTSNCLVVDVENASTNITGQEALLGPLADNDGPTETHALLSDSPAIDSASCTDIDGNPISIDQRGYPRPLGTSCDIGSFELSELPNIALVPNHFEQTLIEGTSATDRLMISNIGMGPLEWTASEDVAWLSASPISGTITANSVASITVSIDASNLTPNNYTGTLTITSNDLANPSLEVSVLLTVTSLVTSTPTPTSTPTVTPSVTNTPTFTPSVTNTPTVTPSVTNTPTFTPSVTNTPTSTPSVTSTPTDTGPTSTPSTTSTATQTAQATATATMRPTMTPTMTSTASGTITDNDYDGVDDDVENGAPNDGDGNLDGIPDSQQDNVTSLLTVYGDYVTLSSPEGTTLVEVQPMSEPDLMPPNFDFSQGLFDFKITASSAVSVTLILHNMDEMPDSYWKFGPTLNNSTPHWYEFIFDGTTGAVISEQMITLYFVDGTRGDADRIKNGQIVDPGAPAWRMPWLLFLPLTQR